MGHETSRHATTAGEAAPTGYPVVTRRDAPVGRGPLARRGQELCLTVGPRLRTAWRQRASAHPDPWAAAPVVPRAESEAGDPAAPRAPRARTPDRSLDAPAHRAPDLDALPHPVPPQPRVAGAAGAGLECAETGAPGPPAGRRGDRALEAPPLAPYKKTPTARGPIWSSSMRAGSSSSRLSNAPGPPRARRPTSTTSISTTGSPPSARLRCHPSAGTSRCTSGSAPGISRGWMSGASSGTCCSTCGARWPCSGTGARSIDAARCRSSFATGRGSSGTTSPRTPRNSTPPSMSGHKPTPRCPTPPPRTWWTSKRGSDPQFAGPDPHNSSCGPASMLLTYHGRDEGSFLYLYEPQ